MLRGCYCVAFINLKTQKIVYLQLDLEGSTGETFFTYIELLLGGADKPKEALSLCVQRNYLQNEIKIQFLRIKRHDLGICVLF